MEFSQIATLLVIAALFGIVAKFFKQPLIVGYILAGAVLGASGVIGDIGQLKNLAQIGVTLLLFSVGIEMNLAEMPSVGRVVLLTGITQVFATSAVGFVLARFLGFEVLPAIYLAVGLTFSSTVIVVRLLSEKKDLRSLYGRIAVGVLLIQDFFAIAILMFLSGIGQGSARVEEYLIIAIKGISLLALVWFLSKKLIPRIFEKMNLATTELLFIVTLAWALGFSNLVAKTLGFTLEIGGFLAGLALSNVSEHLQIAGKVRALRDFFLTIFFLTLGMQFEILGGRGSIVPYALIFSTFVIIANPIIVFIILGFLGYKKRTSFLAGLTFGQVSEFSLILLATGQKLGHITSREVSLLTLVAALTMTLSTYLILSADKIYIRLKKFLKIFERKQTVEDVSFPESKLEDHIILVGCDRTGRSLVSYLTRRKLSFVVVDFNPKVFVNLSAEKIPVVFGDINDFEVLDKVNVERARMIISTINNLTDNLTLIEYLRALPQKPSLIFTSSSKADAIKLYEAGCTYVVVPEVVAGNYVRHLLKVYGEGARLTKIGKRHFNRLMLTQF